MNNERLKIFNILLDAGEWSDKALLELLTYTIIFRKDKVAKELLLRGADPSVKCLKNRTWPLLLAVADGENAVVDVLLADPRTDYNMRCPYDFPSYGTRTVLQKAAKMGNIPCSRRVCMA